MSEIALTMFCLIILMTVGVLASLSVFALGDPQGFARWLSPYYFLSRMFLKASAAKLDHFIAYLFGGIFLATLLLVSFGLGGWSATVVFDLRMSPFARIFLLF